MRVHCQLLVCPNIKQTNCRVIAASSECVTIRKELENDMKNKQISHYMDYNHELQIINPFKY